MQTGAVSFTSGDRFNTGGIDMSHHHGWRACATVADPRDPERSAGPVRQR